MHRFSVNTRIIDEKLRKLAKHVNRVSEVQFSGDGEQDLTSAMSNSQSYPLVPNGVIESTGHCVDELLAEYEKKIAQLTSLPRRIPVRASPAVMILHLFPMTFQS